MFDIDNFTFVDFGQASTNIVKAVGGPTPGHRHNKFWAVVMDDGVLCVSIDRDQDSATFFVPKEYAKEFLTRLKNLIKD